jgi:hypothetical protein
MHDSTNSHTVVLSSGNKSSNIDQGLGDSKGKIAGSESGEKRKRKVIT